MIVFITGLLNIPIGLGMAAQGIMSGNPELLPVQTVLGAFIIFGGAALMWASRDLQTRAPLVVWNALVRSVGFASGLYLFTTGNIPMSYVAIATMDLVLAFIYIIGITKYTGIPLGKLLLGKS